MYQVAEINRKIVAGPAWMFNANGGELNWSVGCEIVLFTHINEDDQIHMMVKRWLARG